MSERLLDPEFAELTYEMDYDVSDEYFLIIEKIRLKEPLNKRAKYRKLKNRKQKPIKPVTANAGITRLPAK